MPNRIIRESCRTSPTLAKVSADAERLFWRLITVADDYGRFDADADVVRCQCFPLLLARYSRTVVDNCLQLLASVSAIHLYTVGDHTYGVFTEWAKHQRRRAAHSKYPAPSSGQPVDCGHSLTGADSGGQPLSKVAEESRNRGIEESRTRGQLNGARAHFDRWWQTYPKKVAKEAAWKAWQRVSPDDALVTTMLAAVRRQQASEQWRESERFIPHPTTWLNQRRWEDDLGRGDGKTDAVRNLEAALED